MVMENIPVTTEWMDRTEAEKIWIHIISKFVPGKVSVISDPGVDVQACAELTTSNRADRISK